MKVKIFFKPEIKRIQQKARLVLVHLHEAVLAEKQIYNRRRTCGKSRKGTQKYFRIPLAITVKEKSDDENCAESLEIKYQLQKKDDSRYQKRKTY